MLFVKLRQFHPEDLERVVIDTRSAEWFPHPGHRRPAAARLRQRRVSLVRWAPHTRFVPHEHPGGEEICVLDGALEDEEGRYAAVSSWLRKPPGSRHMPFSLEGCLLYVKIGAPARRGDVTSARRATVWRKSPKNLAIRRRGSSMAAITLPPEIAREAVDWFASGAGCFFCDRPAESPPRSPARAVWIRLVRILAKGEGALG